MQGGIAGASLAAGSLGGGHIRAEPHSGSQTNAKTWLFWDLWRFDVLRGVRLRQAKATWRPEATFADPLLTDIGSWPTVWRDNEAGLWRMLYSGNWNPYTLLMAESPDGIHWRPSNLPEIEPPGGLKLAPNHLFTLPNGSGGSVYLDPVAADGYPFKVYAIQSGVPVMARAKANPAHFFHELASANQPRRYLVDHLTLLSKNGIEWVCALDRTWNKPHWHPEPPVHAYYNPLRRRHMITARPGHGDRRVVILDAADARSWSEPELLLQPDPMDEPLVQFYGMPVMVYENQFIGLLSVMHCDEPAAMRGFNHSVAHLDVQLAYSYDGIRYQRGFREAFIERNTPGQPGSGVVQPSAAVDTGTELRFYCVGGRAQHGRTQQQRSSAPGVHVLLYTLRRDGFHYLDAIGNGAHAVSKPLTFLAPDLHVNIEAPHGEARFQCTDLKGAPIPGLTFEESIPAADTDALSWKVAWKNGGLNSILRKPVRMEVRFRDARLYAFRGHFHFLDAQDWLLLQDGKPIDNRYFDF